MFNILAIIQIQDFQAFDEFEHKAAKIMADYQGKIVYAFETIRNADGSGEEVHVVEFHQKEDFISYKKIHD